MISLKKKFFITLAVVLAGEVVLAALFVLFQAQIIQPSTEKFISTNDAITSTEQSIADYIKVVAPAFQRNKDFLDHLEELFFSEAQGRQFLKFLKEVVSRNHLTHSITLPPSKGSPAIGFRVEGNFSDVVRFLREIEHEQYLLTIKDVSIQRRNDGAVAAVIQANLATQ